MSVTLSTPSARAFPARLSVNAAPARAVVILSVTVAAAAGLLTLGTASSAHAIAQAGPDLTRLLRAMAGLKLLMAAAALAAVLWRLALPASLPRVAGYALAGAAMAAGPGLIAAMSHVAAGALLLHAGLLVTILMLWQDPATTHRLQTLINRRRSRA